MITSPAQRFVLGALILAAAPFAAVQPAAAQPWLADLISARGASYELYAPTREDIAQAKRELDFASAQFRRHFGAPAPRIAVVMRDTNPPGGYDDSAFRDRGVPLVTWITDRGWAALHRGEQPVAAAGGRPHSESHILPHEACHQFLKAFVDARLGRPVEPRPRTRTPHYGHPLMPDWIDEAAAGVCEHPWEQAQRQARLQADPAGRIPLAQLFTMANPNSGMFRVAAPPGGRAGGAPSVAPGTVVGAMTFGSGVRPAEQMRQSSMFAAQSQSFANFLAERAGPGALGRLTQAIADGRTMAQALTALELPGEITVLERQWLAWLARRR